MAPEEVIETLVGETITGGEVSEDGFHLFTQSGHVLIFIGIFGLYRTEETITH
jgi:hypothetical protein